MAFCFSSGFSVYIRRTFHTWCRQRSSRNQNVLDSSTLETIVCGWSLSFAYFCSFSIPFLSPSLRLTELVFFMQIPVIGIDSLAYGEVVIVPWNIVYYNIFAGSGRGPDLYGTAPWNFYLNNLVLNFNCILPLALISLPALGVTYVIDHRRLGLISPTSNQSSPFTILGLRLAPFYLWLGILSLQPHKEERFMFPAYPLLCFNAAVALYLMRGWMEVAFIKVTNSQYKVSSKTIVRCPTIDIPQITGFPVITLQKLHLFGRRHVCTYLCLSHLGPLALLSRPDDACI